MRLTEYAPEDCRPEDEDHDARQANHEIVTSDVHGTLPGCMADGLAPLEIPGSGRRRGNNLPSLACQVDGTKGPNPSAVQAPANPDPHSLLLMADAGQTDESDLLPAP
jgi:hypothetical protein